MINILPGIDSSSAALTAERTRLDVISENIANVNTTHGANGRPYQRQHVVFDAVLKQFQPGESTSPGETVQVARISKDNQPPRLIYNPGHPDADSNGMVAVPDINIHEEMVDLIAASRAFEANLAVVKNARALAMQELSIGKRG